ncbi:transaldolase B [Pelomyxa schiedti]|nr:transaldolase B [Pelomyxa schiedti]
MASDSEEEVMGDLSKEVEATQDPKAATALDAIKSINIVGCDTAEYAAVAPLYPSDVSTNPSLILQASKQEEYSTFIKSIVDHVKAEEGTLDEKVCKAMDNIIIGFGIEMLKVLKGRVSTELDPRLSYNAKGTQKKAREIIAKYEARGIPRSRVLIKIAATPEGLRAAKQLEREGIRCNMTLVFSIYQVAKSCEVKSTVISPFVGRISDWHTSRGKDCKEDPGVAFARDAYNYVHGNNCHPTPQVQASSFRTTKQVLDLVGCDVITISPTLLRELLKMPAVEVQRKLHHGAAAPCPKMEKVGSKQLRWHLVNDEMANDLLSDGIRRFTKDTIVLEDQVRQMLQT